MSGLFSLWRGGNAQRMSPVTVRGVTLRGRRGGHQILWRANIALTDLASIEEDATWTTLTHLVSAGLTRSEYEEVKRRFPAISPSATFGQCTDANCAGEAPHNRRRRQEFVQHSGYYTFDIDDLGDRFQEAWDSLAAMPYVAALIPSVSRTGIGVLVLSAPASSPQEHASRWEIIHRTAFVGSPVISAHLERGDSTGQRDVTRLRFITWPVSAYHIAESPVPFEINESQVEISTPSDTRRTDDDYRMEFLLERGLVEEGQVVQAGERHNAILTMAIQLLRQGLAPADAIEHIYSWMDAGGVDRPGEVRGDVEAAVWGWVEKTRGDLPPEERERGWPESQVYLAKDWKVTPDAHAVRVWDALLETEASERVFRSPSGQVLRVSSLGHVEDITRDNTELLIHEMEPYVTLIQRNKDDELTRVPFPKPILTHMVSLPPNRVKVLHGVSTSPRVTRWGHIRYDDGYDAESGYLFTLSERSRLIDPSRPMKRERILRTLYALLGQFPFGGVGERTLEFDEWCRNPHVEGYLALLITLVLKPVIGNTPLFLIHKSSAGAGGTLLTDLAHAIIFGDTEGYFLPPREDRAEADFAFDSALQSGSPTITFDNVRSLKNPRVYSAITKGAVESRIKGSRNRMTSVFAVMMASGNNVELSDEMRRRVFPIHIDRLVRNPADYVPPEGWWHDPLKEAMKPVYLQAVLSAVQRASTSPIAIGLDGSQWGSFGEWSELVPIVTRWLLRDIEEPFGLAAKRIAIEQDDEGGDWTSLMEQWWTRYGDTKHTVRSVLMWIEDLDSPPTHVPFSVSQRGNASDREREVRRALEAQRGRVYDIPGRRIRFMRTERSDDHSAIRYGLEVLEELPVLEDTRIEITLP